MGVLLVVTSYGVCAWLDRLGPSGTQSAINTLTLDELDLFASTGRSHGLCWDIMIGVRDMNEIYRFVTDEMSLTRRALSVAFQSDLWTGKLPSENHFPDHSTRNPDTQRLPLAMPVRWKRNWIRVTDSDRNCSRSDRVAKGNTIQEIKLVLDGFKACHT